MEADFNFFNGLMFASRMMCQAELHHRIPLECYGSRMRQLMWQLIAAWLQTFYCTTKANPRCNCLLGLLGVMLQLHYPCGWLTLCSDLGCGP
jgi:hypothetical protein